MQRKEHLQLNDLNRLVHEPSRLMILANLYRMDSADFTFLMNQTDLTWGILSPQMQQFIPASSS